MIENYRLSSPGKVFDRACDGAASSQPQSDGRIPAGPSSRRNVVSCHKRLKDLLHQQGRLVSHDERMGSRFAELVDRRFLNRQQDWDMFEHV